MNLKYNFIRNPDYFPKLKELEDRKIVQQKKIGKEIMTFTDADVRIMRNTNLGIWLPRER